MSKVVQSVIEDFPGQITIADPLTIKQVIDLEDAVNAGNLLRDEPGCSLMRYYHALLPGLLGCVELWEIEGIDPNVNADNFPGTPSKAVTEFIAWLVDETIIVRTAGNPDPEE